MQAPIGRVYVLSNKAMPGIVKIGFTMGTVELRVAELSSATGVPTPFLIEFQVECRDPSRVEQQAHNALNQRRVNSGREYFSVSPQEAAAAILRFAGTIFAQESRFRTDRKSPEQLIVDEQERLRLIYAEEANGIIDWVPVPTKHWQEFVCLKSADLNGGTLNVWTMSCGTPILPASPTPCSVKKAQYILKLRMVKFLYIANFSENMAKGKKANDYCPTFSYIPIPFENPSGDVFDFLYSRFAR